MIHLSIPPLGGKLVSCPTCDHTMQLYFQDAHRSMSRCPRCGTLKDVLLGKVDIVVPKLVERCREFGRRFHEAVCGPECDKTDWHRLGIAESIHRPEDRPK